MWTVPIVVVHEHTEDALKMLTIGDQQTIQILGANRPDEAFRDRIRRRRVQESTLLDSLQDRPHNGATQARPIKEVDMKRFTTSPLTAAIVAVFSLTLSAQWPLHPLPGVPQGPDGKPNLTAPAPRTADGKPDLSGIWMRSTRTEKPGSAPAGQPPLAVPQNIGANFTDGLPYTPWAADLVKRRAGGYHDPDALCLPQGPMQYHQDGQPRESFRRRERRSSCMSRTTASGPSIPRPAAPEAGRAATGTWHGYSVGRWEGDTLVVESNNFRAPRPVTKARVARCPRQPVYRRSASDGTVPARKLRKPAH